MKKILYIVSTLQRSGPTNQLYNIIRYLDRTRFEPYLITLSSEPADSRWKDYEAVGVQLYAIDLCRLEGYFLAKNRLENLIGQIQPDVIHTQGIRSDVLSADLPLDMPRLCTIHNIPQQDYPMTYGKPITALMLWWHVRSMRRLDMCVGVSKAVCENLQHAFGLRNATTIQNGVDTEIFFPIAQDKKKAFRERLGLPLEGRLWISSGHLNDRKDPQFLIERWKKMFFPDKEDHLVFIGSGPLEKNCKSMAFGCRNIHILGPVDNVADHLRACDYFLSASKAEGLPYSVLEAMACGLPVLLSDIGPHREIWEMSPDIGALFTLGDREAFAVALARINKGARNLMSAATIKLITERLSAKKMSDNYQRLYKNHLSERNVHEIGFFK
ncbi:glycosyltransferase family 4 protein [Alkalispirochaeta alkalica]|uniref:glycosyltransferase family 4 protein n=1 Tax=Alkalispirochaeta alkalica TaxID=46356 RepID=UPI0003A13682|nr:glycosyltransferase family 4 protein [Alkalispirochaeta alkalica]